MRRRVKWLLPLVPLLLLGLAHADRDPDSIGNWRNASRAPVGLAPDPAVTPEGVVQVYAARAVRWRGYFGVHTWIAAKPAGLVFFGWGEIFSLFPSTLTDTFGTKHATANYGCLHMAQGVGSVLGGPIAALLHQSTGSWIPVFAVIITMDFTTAALAILALKPMRRRWLAGRSAVTVAAGEKESGIRGQDSGLSQAHIVSR